MAVPCLALLLLPLAAAAQTCPPPLQFAERKADLMEEVRQTHSENAGRFLTRELLQIWATAPDRRAQALLDRGMAARAAGDHAAAEATLDELIAYCPDYAEGYSQRAFVHMQTGHYAAALDDLDAALERAPNHVAALAGKGVSLIGLGEVAEGERVLHEALRLNPWLPERSLLIAPPGEET